MGFTDLFFKETPTKATFISIIVLALMFLLLMTLTKGKSIGIAIGALVLNIGLLFLLAWAVGKIISSNSVNAGWGACVGFTILLIAINSGLHFGLNSDSNE